MKTFTQCCGNTKEPVAVMICSDSSARISVITAAPASEPMMVPKPPKIEPPPMITAAMASSSRSCPAAGLKALKKAM